MGCISNQFPKLKIKRPLFYNWPIGLRFEIGPSHLKVIDGYGDRLNEKYFTQALDRAVQLFESIFSFHDECTVVYQKFSDGRKRIRKSDFLFHQIDNINERKITFKNIKNIYPLSRRAYCWKRVCISNVLIKDINYKNIFLSLINSDFPPRRPRACGEYFFIHNTKDIILNLYDDRGMDIVSSRVESLQELYVKYSEWLPAYDRVRIENIFRIKN